MARRIRLAVYFLGDKNLKGGVDEILRYEVSEFILGVNQSNEGRQRAAAAVVSVPRWGGRLGKLGTRVDYLKVSIRRVREGEIQDGHVFSDLVPSQSVQ